MLHLLKNRSSKKIGNKSDESKTEKSLKTVGKSGLRSQKSTGKDVKDEPSKQSFSKLCCLYQKDSSFNNKETLPQLLRISRLNFVTISFAAIFITLGMLVKFMPNYDNRYMFIYACIASIHLIGSPFGLLYYEYGNRIFLFVNVLFNLLFIDCALVYCLFYLGFYYVNEYKFASNVPFQVAITIHLGTSILLFTLHCIYCKNAHMFRLRSRSTKTKSNEIGDK